MTFALSTNWCNLRLAAGEEIADLARSLGFDALELGFHTTQEQVAGFKARLDRMPVESVHAFCPVPLSAPGGYPELYQLADADEEARKMAQLQVRRNVVFAAEMGAKTLVLHAGRVACRGFLRRWDAKRRQKRGVERLVLFKRELEALVPELEKNDVVLGLENLPYREGFPDVCELQEIVGDWVKPWYDTGHAYVRRETLKIEEPLPTNVIGMHLNDSNGGDDHLAPGAGKVDFAALADMARQARHRVLEPNAEVTAEELAAGLAHLKDLWKGTETPCAEPDSSSSPAH